MPKEVAQWRPAGIGHRVVHGGTRYQTPVRLDADVRSYLETLVPLAPLHEPANLRGIDAAAAGPDTPLLISKTPAALRASATSMDPTESEVPLVMANMPILRSTC